MDNIPYIPPTLTSGYPDKGDNNNFINAYKGDNSPFVSTQPPDEIIDRRTSYPPSTLPSIEPPQSKPRETNQYKNDIPEDYDYTYLDNYKSRPMNRMKSSSYDDILK